MNDKKGTSPVRNVNPVNAPHTSSLRGTQDEISNGMTIIVKTVTSWIKGLIILFGLYIILFGHIIPGGGFSGGVIFAGAYILLTLAFGSEVSLKNLKEGIAREMDSVGALLFLIVAALGIFFGGTFFINFIHKFHPGEGFKFLSSGTISLSNIAISIKVSMGLFIVFIVLSLLKINTKEEE